MQATRLEKRLTSEQVDTNQDDNTEPMQGSRVVRKESVFSFSVQLYRFRLLALSYVVVPTKVGRPKKSRIEDTVRDVLWAPFCQVDVL